MGARVFAGLMLAALLSVSSITNLPCTFADEPSQQFLDALRERGYYDMALEYLEEMKSSPLATSEFKKRIPFERAATLIASTTKVSDIKRWEKPLNEAEALLRQYKSGAPLDDARTQEFIGSLHDRRSLVYTQQSKSDRLTASEKESFLVKARENYDKARAAYKKGTDLYKSAFSTFQVDPQDRNSKSKKKEIYNSFVSLRTKHAELTEKMADTLPKKDPKRKALLNEALKDFLLISEKYNGLAGLTGYFHAGSCYEKLGAPKKALTELESIFNLGNSSAQKNLKKKALIIACDCWDKIKPYPYDSVIEGAGEVVGVLNQGEKRDKDWLRIQLEVAKAQFEKHKVIKAEKRSGAANEASKLKKEASKLIRLVAKTNSEHREKAKKLMDQWGVTTKAGPDPIDPATLPETFVDARTQAQEYVSDIKTLYSDALRLRYAQARKPEPKTAEQLAAAEEALGKQTDLALQMFDLALKLTDDQTRPTDINSIQYQRSFCYYAVEKYYETIVIGEFLASKYPNLDWTQQASGLVIQSYSKLYNAADPTNRDFEKTRLMQKCDEIIKRYPGSGESSSAGSKMAQLLLGQKELPAEEFVMAEKYYSAIGDEHETHAGIAARLAQKLWFERRRKKNEASPEDLQQLLEKSKNYMSQAVGSANPQTLSYTLALTSLQLVEAELESSNLDNAVKQLESHPIAPLDLLKQKHPAITNHPNAAAFAGDTYKTAIKVYLAKMRAEPGQQQQWIDRAGGVLANMRSNLDDPKARARITSIYATIAQALKTQFEEMDDAEEKKNFAKNLATFLGKIEQDANDGKTVAWAGSTLLKVADSLSDSNLKADADVLYSQSVTALNRAEKLGFANEPSAKQLLTSVERDRALALRGKGDYENAMKALTEILAKSNSNLLIQVEAAKTLELWGTKGKRQKALIEALGGSGTYVNPKTKRKGKLVWGWKYLIGVLKDKEKYKAIFHECFLHWLQTKYEYAKTVNNSGAIKNIAKDIAKLRTRNPDLGGFKKEFDELEKIVKAHK